MTVRRGRSDPSDTSAPFPKVRDTSQHTLTRTSETKGHWQLYDSSAAFRFCVPNRVCCRWCRNVKSAALESSHVRRLEDCGFLRDPVQSHHPHGDLRGIAAAHLLGAGRLAA